MKTTPSTPVDIIPVQSSSEIANVAALAAEIWRQHFTPIIGTEQVDYMLETFQSPVPITRQIAQGAEYYSVTVADEPVGYFCIIPEPEDDKLLLSKLYLKQTCRGLGLGRQALTFIEKRCRELGLRTLRLTVNRDNTRTIDWYKHVGFRITGTQVKDIGNGFVMDDFLMEKPVSTLN